eukprot:866026-Heterocapsa_arctica.AAC.1
MREAHWRTRRARRTSEAASRRSALRRIALARAARTPRALAGRPRSRCHSSRAGRRSSRVP